VSCNAAALQFTYEFRVVELLPGQNPDDAMDRNANFYIARNLTVPMATIPVTYVNRMDLSKTYVAQVKATQSGVGSKMLNYVMLENGGKSPFRQFRVYQPEVKEEGGDVIRATGMSWTWHSLNAFRRAISSVPAR
jgi:hypothetical protein